MLLRSFYDRPTLDVARDLLGKHLCFFGLAGEIIETEAYIAENDPASHAYRGKTKRTEPMFGAPGHAYVYFVYGMYFCLNIVTESKGRAAAVLIRAIRPLKGLETMRKNRGANVPYVNLTNGPAKVCQAFGITKKQNGLDLCLGKEFYLEDGADYEDSEILITPRIGIRVGTELPWRFLLKDKKIQKRASLIF